MARTSSSPEVAPLCIAAEKASNPRWSLSSLRASLRLSVRAALASTLRSMKSWR